MYDLLGVKELGSVNDLGKVALSFELSKAFAPFEELVQGLVLAQLQDNVHIVGVLKRSLELND